MSLMSRQFIAPPPLRDRSEDIPLLCHHFINKLNKALESSVKNIAPEAMAHLLQHHWPGNVRELENAIERAMVLSDSETLKAESFSFTSSRKTTSIPLDQIFEGYSIKNAQKILEEDMITRALTATKGNRTQAAKLLEISHPSLLTKMKMYKIDL